MMAMALDLIGLEEECQITDTVMDLPLSKAQLVIVYT